jgi:hypothetical protein
MIAMLVPMQLHVHDRIGEGDVLGRLWEPRSPVPQDHDELVPAETVDVFSTEVAVGRLPYSLDDRIHGSLAR